MASAAPSGGTFIDNVKRDFPQVTVDESNEDAINTTEFLEATEGLISLFGQPTHVVDSVGNC